MGDISPIWTLLKILFFGFIALLIYSVYTTFFVDKKTIKCTEKPLVSYEFKVEGKNIDTVWIYKFK